MQNSNIIFVTYASGVYKRNIFWNKFFVKLFIRPKFALFYTDDDLKKSIEYKQNKNIFDAKTGAGFWAWKPWAISQAFKLANEGDIVIYQDCGTGLRYKNFIFPRSIIKLAIKNNIMPGVYIPEHGENREWTHKQCFEEMECYKPEYFKSSQVEAVISAWLINNKSKKVLSSWLAYCLNEKIISDRHIDSTTGFATKGHRYDQSVLTNLVIKEKLQPVSVEFIGFHFFKSIFLLELFLRRKETFFNTTYNIIKKIIIYRRMRNC